jgi:hypothetical protein
MLRFQRGQTAAQYFKDVLGDGKFERASLRS